MSDKEHTAMAETVSGIVLYITGIVSLFLGATIAGTSCLIMVAILASVRSYNRTKELKITAEYYNE